MPRSDCDDIADAIERIANDVRRGAYYRPCPEGGLDRAAIKADAAAAVDATPNPYGNCPHCGRKCVERERRLNGNDRCELGHVYPSRATVHSGAKKVVPPKGGTGAKRPRAERGLPRP